MSLGLPNQLLFSMNRVIVSSYGPLHMDVQVLDDQLERIYNSSVQIQDVV